ncbi:hypothetical protein GUJ93_ZPchr0001g30167 [Zizania palustris]|uniref:YTH domain-containing family protein n=1 Tax=Zizania palustris TaxID=103762 RepID=A0A8J5RL79_ZIZPA|nr:hypothetical protein GUJ93_ZPchr0001g30167 [Zizania palustris]
MEEAMENLKVNASTKTSNVNLNTGKGKNTRANSERWTRTQWRAGGFLEFRRRRGAGRTPQPGRKDASSSDATSCISSGDAASIVKESEMSQEAPVGDQGMYYYGYIIQVASFGGWDENGYFVGYNGLEVHPSVFQADNGSYPCYLLGYENGYTSYSPVIPEVISGVDGQYVSKEPYYSSTISTQDPSTPGIFAQSVAYGTELVPAYTWDPSFALLDGVQRRPVGVHQTNYLARSKYSSNKHGIHSSKASRGTKSASDTIKGSPSALDMMPTSVNSYSSSNTASKASGASITKGYPLSSKFVVHTNQGKGNLYQTKGIGLKESGRSWNSTENLKARREGIDVTPSPVAVSRDTYNLPDFVTNYDQALFFVIKSYSEDDIHKSIKYNVWASTPNGNKRLDNAFRLAQERVAEKGIKCPIFLLFSVNASGQFCGVAEMVGPVDFNKNMNFWQQDKWNGFFPVKWHIIKDVPNPQFRHIILENNENKPVTNSRDTQEVKFPQGAEMLKIFKSFSCKTSILDDFDFYENRQKVMLDRRDKPLDTSLDHPMLKAEKPAETKKPNQLVSTVDLDTAKTDEGRINQVATELDTAEISQDLINKVQVEVDTTNSSE